MYRFELHGTWNVTIMFLLFQAMKVVSKKKLMKQCGFPRESTSHFPFQTPFHFCFVFFKDKYLGWLIGFQLGQIGVWPLPVFFLHIYKHIWFMNGDKLSQKHSGQKPWPDHCYYYDLYELLGRPLMYTHCRTGQLRLCKIDGSELQGHTERHTTIHTHTHSCSQWRAPRGLCAYLTVGWCSSTQREPTQTQRQNTNSTVEAPEAGMEKQFRIRIVCRKPAQKIRMKQSLVVNWLLPAGYECKV